MKPKLEQATFEGCPTYNDWLDEQYIERSRAPLDVLGFQPRPSQVLYSMSPDTYQAAFADFLQQREEALKEIVLSDFPSPIAYYFYRFEYGYENDLQRLHFLRDTWEAIVDVVHAVVLGEARFLAMPLSPDLAFSKLFTDSVAQRLLNIGQILSLASARGVQMNAASMVPPEVIVSMRELNDVRNAFSHGAALSDQQARAWITECYEDVLEVINDLRGLSQVHILLYISQASAATMRCEEFRGHSLTKTIRDFELSSDQAHASRRFLRPGQILALDRDRVFGLRPMINSRQTDQGHSTRLCVFRKTHGDVPDRVLEYSLVGQASTISEDRTLLKDDLDDIRALCGLGPD